jgi:hypothetical protein
MIDRKGISNDGISGASTSVGRWSQPSPRLKAKHGLEASIGQDVVAREGSLQHWQERTGQLEEQNQDLLEHSYSSLSEYHSYKQ